MVASQARKNSSTSTEKSGEDDEARTVMLQRILRKQSDEIVAAAMDIGVDESGED